MSLATLIYLVFDFLFALFFFFFLPSGIAGRKDVWFQGSPEAEN